MYSFRSRVRYSECDKTGKLTEAALLDYLQDCAIFHTEDAGYGVRYMENNGTAWLLASWQLDISELPAFGDNIVVETLPYQFRGFVGCRCFIVRNADKDIEYARANSVWTYINMGTLRPERVDDAMIMAYGIDDKIDMEYCSKKLRAPRDMECITLETVTITESHIDTNNHVNNGRYVHMAAGYIPAIMGSAGPVSRIRAEYKKQVYLGDVLVPKIYKYSDRMLVVYEDEDEKVCTNIEFSFAACTGSVED